MKKFGWMKTVGLAGLCIAALSATAGASAQGQAPFKLGTFQSGGREFVGLVLDDTRVIDIARANAAYQRSHAAAPKMAVPGGMNQLIARYEDGLGARLKAIANAEAHRASAPYAYAVATLKILPPTRPAVILNAGANYPEHLAGIGAQTARAAAAAGPAAAPARPAAPAQPAVTSPGLWEHPASDARPDNPYVFLKSPSVVVGGDDDVVVPRGRHEIDWECEFATVVGKPAKNVPVAQAGDYIFGYTIEFDVSDREGRGDRKMGGGPDWFIQKNHDTFGPIGPFIVPKEFFPNPMNTRHYFTLNGENKQDSNTSRMSYNIYEMLSYGSTVLTLSPGDVISHGSPAGTNIERENPRWMKAGDLGVCTVEGVGVQHHHIVDQK
jgi:2-keto-4-pentenoate hydratase/2-oxohepta-3-ene-1,7-dioic acid hydratase in catechol pathway